VVQPELHAGVAFPDRAPQRAGPELLGEPALDRLSITVGFPNVTYRTCTSVAGDAVKVRTVSFADAGVTTARHSMSS
jgi:hypothetical protein